MYVDLRDGVKDFKALITLERRALDVYVGAGPVYSWGRVYGGQVIAQALRAAQSTVPDGYSIHSLHSYFIRPGTCAEEIRFEVDRARDGRSFVTRRVVARQSIGPIVNFSASFQKPEAHVDVQGRGMPEILLEPEAIASENWIPLQERRVVPTEGARATAWIRIVGPQGNDPVSHACALAYNSDDMPTEAASKCHPLHPNWARDPRSWGETFVGASLDHTIWFHRLGHDDDWALYDFQGFGVAGGRGFSIGQIYSRDGKHMATVAQEVLIRERLG